MPAAANKGNDISDVSEWGDSIQEYAEPVAEEDAAIEESLKPVAAGEEIVLPQTEIDMAKAFYLDAGYGEKEAEEAALQYVKEINVLYQEAIANGYDVTDQEIRDYLEELKQQYETAENKEEIQAFMDQFDSEEAYWDFQFEIYKKDLPIQKYNEAREQEYVEEQNTDGNPDEILEIQNEWADEFEEEKAEAVENYEFTVE